MGEGLGGISIEGRRGEGADKVWTVWIMCPITHPFSFLLVNGLTGCNWHVVMASGHVAVV